MIAYVLCFDDVLRLSPDKSFIYRHCAEFSIDFYLLTYKHGCKNIIFFQIKTKLHFCDATTSLFSIAH